MPSVQDGSCATSSIPSTPTTRAFRADSTAVVCEDGREYYAAVEGYDDSAVTPWIEEHVLPQLPVPGYPRWKPRAQIRDNLAAFVTGDAIEFWTMCAWSDWSLVVRLFGRFEDVPPSWPMACSDLWQLEADGGGALVATHDGPYSSFCGAGRG